MIEKQDIVCRQALGQLFGACIQKTRQTRGLSLEGAAKSSEIEPTHWAAIEAGAVPAPRRFRSMACGIGISSEQIALLAIICQGAWK
jgi:hypothetical protein